MKMLLMLLFASQFSWARIGGTEVGNGGDSFPPFHDTAWFLGSRPVKACVVRAVDFPLDETAVRASITSAFSRWVRYLNFKGVYDIGYLYPPEGDTPRSASLRLSENLQLNPVCMGDEDLTFYFGAETPEISENRKVFEDPVSFVQRAPYDIDAGWSRGYVWVGRDGIGEFDWRTPQLLDGTLLHEMGHIFGVGHVPGTIMSEKFVEETLKRARNQDWSNSNRIDHFRELYACLNCDEIITSDYSGALPGEPERQGSMTCDLRFADRFNWEFTIDCRNAEDRHLFTIESTDSPRFASSEIEIFKRNMNVAGELVSESVFALNGQFAYGRLTAADGRRFNVTVERSLNGLSARTVVNLLHDGEIRVLFDNAYQPRPEPCARMAVGR